MKTLSLVAVLLAGIFVSNAISTAEPLKMTTNDSLRQAFTTRNKVEYVAQLGGSVSPSPAQLIENLKRQGKSTEDIVRQLKSVFHLTETQIARLLREAGFTANQVAGALKNVYSATAAQVARWMKDAGFTADQIAGALKSVYNANAAQVAQAMKDAGFTADEAAKALKVAGFGVQDIANAYKTIFNGSIEVIAAFLQGQQYNLAQIITALDSLSECRGRWSQNPIPQSCMTIPRILKQRGYDQVQMYREFLLQFNIPVEVAKQIAKEVFGLLEGPELNSVLSQAGFVVSSTKKSGQPLQRVLPSK